MGAKNVSRKDFLK
jgi:tubulin polyglutamylase TTLL5